MAESGKWIYTKKRTPPLSGKRMRFEVLIMPSIPILRACRVISIPMFMMVSEQGAVEWFHYGAMTKEKVTELLSKIETDS